MSIVDTLPAPCEWTDDCQGKKDYDGDLISVSCRYWPAGGGMDVFDSRAGQWTRGIAGIRPSASASIIMLTDRDGGYVTLRSKNIQSDTEEEVKAQVESWVAREIARITEALGALYADDD